MFKISLIMICLAILMVLTLLSIIFGESFATGILSEGLESNALINGSSTSIEWQGVDVVFSIDPVQGAIFALIGLIVLVAIISIQVLATGLSSSGARTATILIFFIGVWFMVSTLAEPLIRSISIFGNLMYLGLTILYMIGVFQKISGGGGET